MEAIKRKMLPRRFSIKKNEADYDADDADEESVAHIQKEIDEAEKHGYDTGKPGSFLNKLILHGNKKTEEEFNKAAAAESSKSLSSSST